MHSILPHLGAGSSHQLSELRWFKLQELVKGAIVTLKYIGTKEQIADALTKNLNKALFLRLRDFLMGITRFDHSRYD